MKMKLQKVETKFIKLPVDYRGAKLRFWLTMLYESFHEPLTKRVPLTGHRLGMYTIPAGTPVSILNLLTGEKIANYYTRRQLSFITYSRTAYDGHILYFRHRHWEISIHKDRLR